MSILYSHINNTYNFYNPRVWRLNAWTAGGLIRESGKKVLRNQKVSSLSGVCSGSLVFGSHSCISLSSAQATGEFRFLRDHLRDLDDPYCKSPIFCVFRGGRVADGLLSK